MSTTGRFTTLGTTLQRISHMLLDVNNPDEKIRQSARNICKLLYYTEDNPLEQPTGTPLNPDQPRPTFEDIQDVRDHIIRKRVLLVPRVPLEEERGAFIVAIIDNFTLSENKQFKVNTLIFDVLTHYDNWHLEDNLRPFLIMQEIDNIFNNRKLSIGRVEFNTGRTIVLTPYMLGYQLVYRDVTFN